MHIFCYVLAAILTWGGFAALANYNDARGYLVILMGFVAFGLGIFLKKKIKKPEPMQINSAIAPPPKPVQVRQPDMTFSFKPVGSTFDCLYSDIYERQEVLERSGVGDTFHLTEYEWEGKPAFALIHDGMNADFAVVPAKLVKKVKDLYDNYHIIGHITKIGEMPKRDDYIFYCEVQLYCYKDN
ncbi:MAG: hypothetical protein E7232_06710 [Lachnospiraceae bacterium]|jgi:hypothetical protein|nr:hypothetical protein [Lachnospiraceae bacterium]